MQFFYATKSEIKEGLLSEDESKHCVKVLRKQIGDELNLLDGEGGEYTAVIQEVKGKRCKVQVIDEKQHTYNLPDLHLLIAPTKNLDRIEFLIEKSCELGVKAITPVYTYNTERKHLNIDKLRKRMVAACKQSKTLFFPEIYDPVKFKEVLSIPAAVKLIGHCYSHETPHVKTKVSANSTLMLIGPEGDFSKEEVALALDAGFEAVSLGEKRLRTETAGMYVCSCFNLF